MRRSYFVSALVMIGFLAGCSSIRIQTGPPTDEEATQQSEDMGRRFKTDWADRLQKATPLQQADMMRVFMDSTTARFLRFGRQVDDWWRDQSEKRGAQVPVQEVRTSVERSSQLDVPLLEAYEDILEFGISLIRDEKFFDPAAEQKLVEYRDLYLDVYSSVFYPNGTREDFDMKLQNLETQTQRTSQELAERLQQYR